MFHARPFFLLVYVTLFLLGASPRLLRHVQCGHKDRRAELGGEPTISVGSGTEHFCVPVL